MIPVLRLIGDVAVWVALTSAVSFCAMYAVLAPWRASAEGWHLMTFTAVIGAAFGWIAYRQTTTGMPNLSLPTEVARALILTALAALLVWRLALLIRSQTRRRRYRAMRTPDSGSPLPGEPFPTPPPGGATDADLDGVDVTEEYRGAEVGRATAGQTAGTWPAVLAYARSYLGTYPPGRRRENVNDFTVEYYGTTSIAAAWCMIFVWHCLRHFGLISWKLAYVPWLYKVDGFRSGHAGIRPGDICAVAGFSHVGFFVADHGSSFDLLSGNSTSGSSSDAITVKRYPKTVIAGYARPAYATEPSPATPDDCWMG